jgi:hypothetical protein
MESVALRHMTVPVSGSGRYRDSAYDDFYLDTHQHQISQVTNMQQPADPRKW